MITIEAAGDLGDVRALFLEYADAIDVDLAFQDFDRELATLPGDYDPILVAHVDGAPAGCAALHAIGDRVCELKRLYVRPQFRGHGLARALTLRMIAIARERGHRAIRLDTLPTMTAAMALYESLGFRDIDPYRYNPIPGSRFLELELEP